MAEYDAIITPEQKAELLTALKARHRWFEEIGLTDVIRRRYGEHVNYVFVANGGEYEIEGRVLGNADGRYKVEFKTWVFENFGRVIVQYLTPTDIQDIAILAGITEVVYTREGMTGELMTAFHANYHVANSRREAENALLNTEIRNKSIMVPSENEHYFLLVALEMFMKQTGSNMSRKDITKYLYSAGYRPRHMAAVRYWHGQPFDAVMVPEDENDRTQ